MSRSIPTHASSSPSQTRVDRGVTRTAVAWADAAGAKARFRSLQDTSAVRPQKSAGTKRNLLNLMTRKMNRPNLPIMIVHLLAHTIQTIASVSRKVGASFFQVAYHKPMTVRWGWHNSPLRCGETGHSARNAPDLLSPDLTKTWAKWWRIPNRTLC
jgi:hypothetical protein